MLFRLCTVLGAPYIHPDRLAEDLTTAQVDDWLEYADVENFAGPADDYRAGLIAYAALAGGGRVKATATPTDFTPQWSSEPLTPEEYMERARAVYATVAPRN